MNGAMHGNFGIAGVQMNVSAFENNVERMGNYLRHIRGRFPWVRMVLFSELAPLGPRHHNAEPLPGPTETRLTELARETGLWLIRARCSNAWMARMDPWSTTPCR